MAELVRHCVAMGYTGAVISGTVRQRQLYEHVGFIPFGPLVGTADAPYQPMYITIEALREMRVPFTRSARATDPAAPVSFLPGPVDIHPDVLSALSVLPVSHRDAAFLAELDLVKETLRAIVGAAYVEILLGSGTLANDVVAGQLSQLPGPGLVLANGEFGERLIDHATRAGLAFELERYPWGAPIDRAEIDRALDRHAAARWVWVVHLETSTGVLNDLDYLASHGTARGMPVAADCVSAVGVIPVDASRLHLATTVSGKGIASVSGLAMVFHRGALVRHPRLPRYLDLALYAESGSVPFTQSSNLVRALGVAARRTIARGRFGDLANLAPWLRQELRARGLTLVAPEGVAAPGIVTVALDADTSSVELGDALHERGFALNYRSGYLQRRNWIQIALMGECSRDKVRRLLSAWDETRERFSNL
jgi:aspartate aminotransferase-like enzyme